MTYLFFDTETTGLNPREAHLVQLGAVLTDDELNDISVLDIIVKCPIPIPGQAQMIHGITQEINDHFGVRPKAACSVFFALAQVADHIVAHNFSYDDGIMETCFRRQQIADFVWQHDSKLRICTMLTAMNDIKLPGRPGKYKWPKLSEAISHYYPGESQTKAHTALGDVRDCIRVFRALRSRGLL